MKLRKGFVSNSSSSSFVIPESDYASVFDLAKLMIPAREWKEDKALIKKIEEAEIKGMDPNTSIFFTSCNYDTYITKYKNYYLITTCNNHNWENNIDTLGHFPKELSELVSSESFNKSYAYEELESVIPKLSSFWYPEFNIGGTPVIEEDIAYKDGHCSKHFKTLIKVKGLSDPICPECHFIEESKKEKEKNRISWKNMTLLDKLSFVEKNIFKVKKDISLEDKKKIYETLEQIRSTLCGSLKNLKVESS